MSKTPVKTSPRATITIVAALALVLLSAGILRALLPDPTRALFLKAQKLEGAQQWSLALRHYVILSTHHPESYYAPLSLERQAAILASLGRPTGNAAQLRQAMDIYGKLAQTYPESSRAADALLSAGAIALTDLRKPGEAKKWYSQVLERFPNSREFASQAMVKLGRIALQERDREGAQTWFQRVLQRYPQLADRGAEAQYHLGVAYETLWRDAQHKQWAKNAYEATFKRYPQSVYAADARERLGLLFYVDSARQPLVRRVLIDVPPLPSAGESSRESAGLLNALRVVLAARGLEVDEAILRGWSLQPFRSALDTQNPERVIKPLQSSWQNIVSAAGLRYAPLSGGKESEALRDLQSELDMARPPLIFHGKWSLAVGYDSSRSQVFLQNTGSSLETLSTRELAQQWKQDAPIGGSFAMVGFWGRGERPKQASRAARSGATARINATPTPKALDGDAPVEKPTPTPTALPGQSTPTYIYTLPALNEREVHRRALRNAVALLRRPRQESLLLNAEALSFLSRELRLCAQPPATTAAPAPESQPDATPAGETPGAEATTPTQAEGAPVEGSESPVEPQTESDAPARLEEATPTATRRAARNVAPNTPRVASVDWARRARLWRGWFGAPLESWLVARRDAAAFCDAAGRALNQRALFDAAQAFRDSAQAMEAAREAMPPRESLMSSPLPRATRQALQEASLQLRRAAEAENRAAEAMSRA